MLFFFAFFFSRCFLQIYDLIFNRQNFLFSSAFQRAKMGCFMAVLIGFAREIVKFFDILIGFYIFDNQVYLCFILPLKDKIFCPFVKKLYFCKLNLWA